MTDNYKKDLPAGSGESLKVPEKKVEPEKEWSDFGKERQRQTPEKETSVVDEKSITDQLKQEIELMGLDEKLKEEAKHKALKTEFLGEKEKIEHLLKVVHEKGVLEAVRLAKESNDPYLLDILHDILAREGYYKKMSTPGNNDDDDKK